MERDLLVFHIRFKIFDLLFFGGGGGRGEMGLEVLICPRLRSRAKWAVFFKERVNFKLCPRQAFLTS